MSEGIELPTIVHITHWKAGSQWIRNILQQCCPERIVKPGIDGSHLLDQPVRPGSIYPTVYLPHDVVRQVAVPNDTRYFAVLRDPRDTLVSLYFSYKVSHVLSTPFLADVRKELLAVSEEEGLLRLVTGDKMRDVFQIHSSWITAGVPILFYESLLERDTELLLPLWTSVCPLGVPEETICAAIERNRFEHVTGRERGVENVESHFRRGQPGDWRRHFTPRIAEAFEARFGDAMRRLGYTRDASWTIEAEGRSTRPRLRRIDVQRQRPFSVIMVLPQHRGHAAKAVRSWSDAQRYPSDRYELIVVSDGESPAVDSSVTTLLRPNDRLLVIPGANRSLLLNRGIQAARFSQLVFTEAHIEPEDRFLIELDNWIADHPEVDAAYCRVVPTYENHLAFWDGQLDAEGVAKRRDGNEWWNVNIHALTLSTSCLNQVGGLDENYDLFSMVLLAAKLRDKGMKIAYAASPAVHHHYRTTLDEVEAQTRSFVRDEFRYRMNHSGLDRVGLSVLPSDLDQRSATRLWQEAWSAAWQHRHLGNLSLIARLSRHLARRVAASFRFAEWLAPPARRLTWSKIQCQMCRWNRKRLESPYRRFRQSIAAAEYHRLVARSPDRSLKHEALETGRHIAATEVGSAVAGLHSDETDQGVTFRWTEPTTLWRFGRCGERGLIEFDLLPVRTDLKQSQVQAYWNGRRIPMSAMSYSPDRLVVRLPWTPSQLNANVLVLIVPRLRVHGPPPRDPRPLGLAMIQLKCDQNAVDEQRTRPTVNQQVEPCHA